MEIKRVPGKGNREIIDTTYEVRDGDAVLAVYGNSRDAETFKAGWEAAQQRPADQTSISFTGEACEAFSTWVSDKREWYVKITPLDGSEPFDACLVGDALNNEIDGYTWYDAVTFLRADPETGLAIEGTPIEAIRVRDILVY